MNKKIYADDFIPKSNWDGGFNIATKGSITVWRQDTEREPFIRDFLDFIEVIDAILIEKQELIKEVDYVAVHNLINEIQTLIDLPDAHRRLNKDENFTLKLMNLYILIINKLIQNKLQPVQLINNKKCLNF